MTARLDIWLHTHRMRWLARFLGICALVDMGLASDEFERRR